MSTVQTKEWEMILDILGVIPQLQGNRMRLEIELVCQVWLPILSDVVVDQGDRDDQR